MGLTPARLENSQTNYFLFTEFNEQETAEASEEEIFEDTWMQAIRQLEQTTREQCNKENEEDNATKEVIKDIWIKEGNDWGINGIWSEAAQKINWTVQHGLQEEET